LHWLLLIEDPNLSKVIIASISSTIDIFNSDKLEYCQW